jgi:hypothetical protein
MLALVVAEATCFARPTEEWTSADLYSKADVVCIAHVTGSSDVDTTEEFGTANERFVVQIETLLDADVALKGMTDRQIIRMVHFRERTRKEREEDGEKWPFLGLVNGPRYVQLEDEESTGPEPTPARTRYLVFLKHIEDDRYAPVTGYLDASQSIYRLEEARTPKTVPAE